MWTISVVVCGMWIVDLGMWIRGCGFGGEYITCGLCCQHLTGYMDCGILL